MKLLLALSCLIASSTAVCGTYCDEACDDDNNCFTDDGDEGCIFHQIVPSGLFSSAPPKCLLKCVPCGAISAISANPKFVADCPDNEDLCLHDEIAQFCGSGGYRRVLSAFDDRRLFALMEGKELNDHSKKHKDKKENASLGICDHAESGVYGNTVSYDECFGHGVPTEGASGIHTNSGAFKPWSAPSDDRASLLASDPGIWAVENFFSDEETDKIVELAEKYGNDLGMYGPCANEEEGLSASAHPPDKWCFMISTQKVCDGDHRDLHCPIETQEDDKSLVADILSSFQGLWSTKLQPVSFVKFHLSKGGTPPVDLHTDVFSVSFLLYLTNGGASTLFPNADLSIVPSKGTAITWLNMFEDAKRNFMADHAVEAHPIDDEGRLVMLLNFEVSPLAFLKEA